MHSHALGLSPRDLRAMGPPSSKSTAVATPWYVDFDKSMRGMVGIPEGGLFVTGLDAVTLPFAFIVGAWIGAGVGVWRGDNDLMRPMRGMGTFLVGLTLAVPAYIRIGYMPFLFITPSAFAWSFLTGGIIGAGWRMLRAPGALENADALANPHDEELERFGDLMTGSLGAAVIASGLYLALPGPVRVLMMYA